MAPIDPSTSSIVRHDSHLRKFGSDPAGDRNRFALVGGEQSNHSSASTPFTSPSHLRGRQEGRRLLVVIRVRCSSWFGVGVMMCQCQCCVVMRGLATGLVSDWLPQPRDAPQRKGCRVTRKLIGGRLSNNVLLAADAILLACAAGDGGLRLLHLCILNGSSCVLEVPGSIPSPALLIPVFQGFPETLEVNAGMVPLHKPWYRLFTIARLPPRRTGFDPRPAHSGCSHVGIVPDDAAVRQCFLGDLPIPLPLQSGAAPNPHHFIPIGSQDLDLKRRPNLSTKSPVRPTSVCEDTSCPAVNIQTKLLSNVLFPNHIPTSRPCAGRITDCLRKLKTAEAVRLVSEITSHAVTWPAVGAAVTALASHQASWVRIPAGSLPEFSHVGIVPNDAAGWVFSGISHFPPPLHSGAAPYSSRFILIGSQDPDVHISSIHPTNVKIGVGQCWVHAQKTNKRSTSALAYCWDTEIGCEQPARSSTSSLVYELVWSGTCDVAEVGQEESITRELACRLQGKPDSIPARVTPGRVVTDDAAGRRVFSATSRFPRPFIPAQLHTHLSHPHRLSRPHC
ncbi:hypothetical protein PR048_008976 [Dryococelus australis]|uniref:Uncharacterized protein n=1 Tax=Dryococelus australis TaxID=614101 RepID=A0ABQ9HYZ7_9NEOP|nr:hypothetical protein PR048_008976 [Dryococelus australis]